MYVVSLPFNVWPSFRVVVILGIYAQPFIEYLVIHSQPSALL